MTGLHFAGRTDAYLEWAVATGFAWMDAPDGDPQRVDLLVDEGPALGGAVRVAAVTRAQLKTGLSALPSWPWMELAQAIRTRPSPGLLSPTQELGGRPRVVLGLIDSGIGSDWLAAQAMERPVFHWDMSSVRRPVPRASHGAHVLSWLAGRPPYPGLQADLASRCPLLLVNLPQQAVDDPTGRWLGRYMLDGLDFMIAQALHITAQRLVVNISWGPQTGPHDGSSLLERALVQRIASAQRRGLALDIVLAAGNSRESRAHAQFDAQRGCDTLHWVVPPAGPAPAFLELWWPAGTDLSQVSLQALAPDGQCLTLRGAGGASVAGAQGFLVPHPLVGGGMRPMALLALHPTGDAGRAAPHGRWALSVRGIPGAQGQVHVYVARQSANLGGRYRGLDSHLDEPDHGQQRFRRHPRLQHDGPALIRSGTLSGLATAPGAGIHVAAGSVWSSQEACPYSSEGPGLAAGATAQRPDWALPTDETPMLRGLLGAGSRPGSVLRLVGTSMAAPQLARLLLHGLPPLPPAQPWEARRGQGPASLGWRSRQRH